MAEPQVAPYGSWKSPITSDRIVSGTIGLEQVVLDGEDIYWIETRPLEGGRHVIVRRTPDGQTRDVNPPPFNARTRVHEYGGGSYAVRDGVVYFSNFADQRLYRQVRGEAPVAITPDIGFRYADAQVTPQGHLLCVREDHTRSGQEAVNTVVQLAPDSGDGGSVLASGNDFYAAPRCSPDRARLAWLAWDHPNMPWDGNKLCAVERGRDSAGIVEQVAGGESESIFQPEWSPEDVLHFVSDRTGWWNLYRWRDGKVQALCPMEAEFGRPMWVFGKPTYAFAGPGQVVCSYTQRGIWNLALLDTNTGRLERLDTPYTDIWNVRATPGQAVFCAASATEPASVVRLDLGTSRLEVLRRSSSVDVDAGYLSVPQAIEFPTSGGATAHAFYYPPRNRDFAGPAGERPPLLVISHGGPTGATAVRFQLETQFWTSRGVGVLDVNYRGSTGYGRAYRAALNGEWGVADVDDCVHGARYLVERGEVDANRLAIRGGSAGGYTTLCALTFRDVFRAGASYYGVSDLEALAKETHKFESRYLDNLIGPYPARQDLYRERSPIHFTDRLSCPAILFQGLEDKVVLPNQAEMMFEALRAKGLPVAYVPFEGEQHGFRRAENIKRALDGELYFYGRVFGFELAEPVEPVRIENLPG
ncbi:MAG: S9 family peptidase [Gemmataceae bacterium]|nr:S9 family peptidase [Gemmataceae bacterium]